MSDKIKGGKSEQSKQNHRGIPPQQQQPAPTLPPPFMTARPPPQMAYPPGTFQFVPGAMPGSPADPNQQQQHLLQLQLRQQQLQLQQMQQQQQAAVAQQAAKLNAQSVKQQQQTSTTKQAISQSMTKTALPSPKPAPSSAPKKPAPPPPPSNDQLQQWLSQCDWKDKTIYSTRQLFGGNSVNGFSRATAAAMRIRKSRQRQVKTTKRKAAAAASATTGGDQQQQQVLPHPPQSPLEEMQDVLNPRTAKRIKMELQQGAAYCKHLYETIQSVMKELDPSGRSVMPPIHLAAIAPPRVSMATTTASRARASTSNAKSTATTTYSAASKSSKSKAALSKSAAATAVANTPAAAAALQGSSLRKLRKRKLASYPHNTGLSEHDSVSGKRLYTKKEHNARIAQVLRFRGLKAGDYVAARLSSRDLWILARVTNDYPPVNMNSNEFLKLTDAKRDSLFKNKVIVKDAEEKASAEPIAVARQLILPLPRTYAEAAEWGTRLKKGLRVYAMYPHTTSLYVATVIDNTTYCRGDDDVVVVEFDEDERDATGALPKCHIPARFCIMIPPEFHQTTPKKKATTTSSSTKQTDSKQTKRASKKATPAAAALRQQMDDQTDPALNSMLTEMDEALGEFNPLVDFGTGG